MAKIKELTEKQELFLEALFGEANFDYKKAQKIAGYADSVSTNTIVAPLADEIISRSKTMLAVHTPRAMAHLIGMIDDPSAVGNQVKLKAIAEIMDRAGLTKKEEVKVDTDGQNAILILPAKRNDD